MEGWKNAWIIGSEQIFACPFHKSILDWPVCYKFGESRGNSCNLSDLIMLVFCFGFGLVILF